MNKRIKELRKSLGLSGEKFGEKLGVTRTAISLLETGKNNLTEQMIKAICRTYHVNEGWLRTGEGDMFASTSELSLDELAGDADPLELDILKAYFSLDKDLRQQALKHFKEELKK
ncbi:helix-turn-helix domain-containing protein [Peptococcus simiae]|uniref:helix-turn-helix domain-containing protein n=1 Tax=Peptococcus simiae TaxID=1643805 RepID=UPI00398049CD